MAPTGEPRIEPKPQPLGNLPLLYLFTVCTCCALFLLWRRASTLRVIVAHQLKTWATRDEGRIRLSEDDGPPARSFVDNNDDDDENNNSNRSYNNVQQQEEEDEDEDSEPLAARAERLRSGAASAGGARASAGASNGRTNGRNRRLPLISGIGQGPGPGSGRSRKNDGRSLSSTSSLSSSSSAATVSAARGYGSRESLHPLDAALPPLETRRLQPGSRNPKGYDSRFGVSNTPVVIVTDGGTSPGAPTAVAAATLVSLDEGTDDDTPRVTATASASTSTTVASRQGEDSTFGVCGPLG